MRTYSSRMLDKKIRMFNYRFSRARKIVECIFGTLNAKFKIFEGPMCCKEENFEFSHQSICCPPQFHQNLVRAVL
jgi:hypothetical protein